MLDQRRGNHRATWPSRTLRKTSDARRDAREQPFRESGQPFRATVGISRRRPQALAHAARTLTHAILDREARSIGRREPDG